MKASKQPIPIAAAFTNDRVIGDILGKIKEKFPLVEILDLGTGHGYNPWKLLHADIGERKLKFTCVDVNDKDFELSEREEIDFRHYDLNKSFDFGKFDFIIATEVIEHLENPYAFIRNCVANLKEGGILYISTPNVANIYSIIKIFLRGVPYCFLPYEKGGHEMPVFPFMMDIAMDNLREQYGEKVILESFYNKNIFKLYPFSFQFWLPGYQSRLLGESAIWKIYFIK